MTSTFKFKNVDEGDEIFGGASPGYVYTRCGNPTTDLLERRMAALSHGEAAVAFGSGMAAIAAVFLQFLQKGDQIVAHRNLYGCTFALTDKLLPKYGIDTTFVNMTSLENLERAITPQTKLVFFRNADESCARNH